MYKIIVVDDEDEVREGIAEKLDWAACGYELVGVYDNGRDAWESMERVVPDVVVTDIAMPFMDGLQLAAAVAGRYRDMKTVMITGYDEFEYAQQAVKLKVSDFVLKPVNQRELTELLAKLKRELDEERERREDLTRLRSQLRESLPLMRERFLERLVTQGAGAASASAADLTALASKFAYYGLSLQGEAYVALLVDVEELLFDYGSLDRFEDETELIRFAVYNVVQKLFEREQGAVVFRTREERIGILLAGAEDGVLLQAQKLGQQALECIEKYVKVRASIGVGRPVAAARALHKSYAEAAAALDYRLLIGANKLIYIEDAEGHNRQTPQLQQNDWERKLVSAVRSGSPALYRQLLQEWIGEVRQSQPSAPRCHVCLQRFLVSLLQLCEDVGVELDDAPALFGHVQSFKTLEEASDWLERLGVQVVERLAARRERETDTQLRKAEAYILERYQDENLSLGEVSQHVFMSMNYFSGVFKQIKGLTFIEYLTRLRIDKAKELLSRSELKAYEIAAQVGYSDPQYFSVIFKRGTGMTPKQFRAWARGAPA